MQASHIEKILKTLPILGAAIIVLLLEIVPIYIINNNINKYDTAQTVSYADKINVHVELSASYAGDYSYELG